jgi:hypothetical protein
VLFAVHHQLAFICASSRKGSADKAFCSSTSCRAPHRRPVLDNPTLDKQTTPVLHVLEEIRNYPVCGRGLAGDLDNSWSASDKDEICTAKLNVMYDVTHHVRRMFLPLIPGVPLG